MLLGLLQFQTVLTIGGLVVTENIALLILVVIISVLLLPVMYNLPYQRIQTCVINMTFQKNVSHHLTGRVFQIVLNVIHKFIKY